MSSIWGQTLKISLFGESHGPAIGVVIDNLPAGMALDMEKIAVEMGRRRPSTGAYSTKRKEPDKVEILSGFFKGHTTGTPLCALIRNQDSHSADYEATKGLARPGHADYTAFVRYRGYQDYRGGGHFSARLTAPLVFAGAVAKHLLDANGITVGSHIQRIGEMVDVPFDGVTITAQQLEALRQMPLPALDASCPGAYMEIIEEARKELDSVGGVVETAVVGLPAGVGSPLFNNVEARLSSLLFSVPAVKGLEFGTGFALSSMRGSEANDSFESKDGKVTTRTNHNGGINGGITNGMPLLFRTAFKPTPSISQLQQTVDLDSMENAQLQIKGRHDACIVPRAVPVVEAACAIVLSDLLLSGGVDLSL